jgi:hypothetical protein
MTARRRTALAAAAVLLLSGCTSFADTVGDRRAPNAAPAPKTTAPGTTTPGIPAEPLCPAVRAAPDPDRPVVVLDFRLEDDLRTVTGTQEVVFTPDRPTGSPTGRSRRSSTSSDGSGRFPTAR